MKKIIDYRKLSKRSIDSKFMFDSFKQYIDNNNIKPLIESHIPVFHRYYNKVLKNIPWDNTTYEDYCQEYVIKLLKFVNQYRDKVQYYGTYYNFVDKMTYNFCVTRHNLLQGKKHNRDDYENLDSYRSTVYNYGEGADITAIKNMLRKKILQQIMDNRPFTFATYLKTHSYDELFDSFFDALIGNCSNKDIKKEYLYKLIKINYRWITVQTALKNQSCGLPYM